MTTEGAHLRTTSARWSRRGVLGAAALAAAGVPLLRTTSARADAGDAHLVVPSSSAGLFHAMRLANGSWTRFGDVGAATGSAVVAGAVRGVGATFIDGNVHVTFRGKVKVGRTTTDSVWHAIRYGAGNWSALGDVCAQAGRACISSGIVAGVVSTSTISHCLHVLVDDGTDAWQAIRFPTGSWTTFESVKALAGDPGNITKVAVAGADGPSLHVLAGTASGDLYHSMNDRNGTWSPFGYVFGQTGFPGRVAGLSATAVGGTLHVAITQEGYGTYHAERRTDGSWTAFEDVSRGGGVPGGGRDVGLTSSANGRLQLTVTTLNGGVLHTTKDAGGSWQPYGDVIAVAGGFSGSASGPAAMALW